MRYYILSFFFFVVISCKTEKQEIKQDYFEIKKHRVGVITDTTQIKDLNVIFFNDSIVNYKEDDSFVGGINTYDIFENRGNPLLSVVPNEALDSSSTINFVEIKDPRYKTQKGISTLSTFKDLKNAYVISEFRNTLNAIELVINEIDATFIIHKKELLTTFDYGVEIDSTQLPDNSKFSSFIIHF